MAISKISNNRKVILDTPITIVEDGTDHIVIALPKNHVYRIDILSYLNNVGYPQSVVASLGNSNNTTVVYNKIYTNLTMRMLIMGGSGNWNIAKIDGTSTGANITIQKIIQID